MRCARSRTRPSTGGTGGRPLCCREKGSWRGCSGTRRTPSGVCTGRSRASPGGALAVPEAPRTDLLPLVTYAAPIAAPGTPAGPIADLLRLNTGVSATPLADASRLGLLDGDVAGFPNGRRVFDDVVDITLRVAVGGVLDPTFPGFNPDVNARLGDGVNVNDAAYRRAFPYLASAPDGRNRRHVDPGEVGGGPIQ